MELRLENEIAERRMYVVKARGRRAGYYVEFDILEAEALCSSTTCPGLRLRGAGRGG